MTGDPIVTDDELDRAAADVADGRFELEGQRAYALGLEQRVAELETVGPLRMLAAFGLGVLFAAHVLAIASGADI